MRRFLATTILGSAMMLASTGAWAQDYYQNGGYYPSNGYYRGNGYYGSDGQYGYNNGYVYNNPGYQSYAGTDYESAVFQRTLGDLDRAASYGSRWDEGRIASARHELFDFQNRLQRGNFSMHELNDSVAAVQHVVDSNHLSPFDRQALMYDLQQLREFRASSSGYSRPYGY